MKTPPSGHLRDAIGVLLLAFFVTACANRSSELLKGTFSCGPEVTKIRIELQNGTLNILPSDVVSGSMDLPYEGGLRMDGGSPEDLARLQAVPAEVVASPDPNEPGTLVVRCPEPPKGTVGMIAFEGSLRIPAKIPVDIRISNNGHVVMVGRESFSKVSTRRGDLRFEACRGGVEANTGQGIVIAFKHEGDLDMRTGLGDMQVFITKPGDEITLSTGKGTVQCHVPANSGLEVDARAEIGRIGGDFGLEVRKVGDYSAAMSGRTGDGKTKVILRTASGHISLIKRK